MTSVQKLSRIVLVCHQAERLAEFYIRAFGFACIEGSPKSDPGFAELIGSANGQVRLTDVTPGGNQVISLAERAHQDAVIRATFKDGIRHFSISLL